MANDNSYLQGLPPRMKEIVEAQAQILADRTLVEVDRANITVAANDTWHYTIPFRLVGEDTGLVLPYTGTLGCTVSLSTGSGPTPVVSSATPKIILGSGDVEVSHGDTGYEAGDVVTVVLTYTNLRGSTDTHNFTVTMS